MFDGRRSSQEFLPKHVGKHDEARQQGGRQQRCSEQRLHSVQELLKHSAVGGGRIRNHLVSFRSVLHQILNGELVFRFSGVSGVHRFQDIQRQFLVAFGHVELGTFRQTQEPQSHDQFRYDQYDQEESPRRQDEGGT